MHVFLDTDIGSDVDDALALAVLLGSPEIDLVGVSTVYGDTVLRARLAARLIALHDDARQIPVAPGEHATRSGRAVWWAGHEGVLQGGLALEEVRADRSGVDLLLEAADRYAGELTVLAIGPLTNIATALDRDPQLDRKVRDLVVMGGDFGRDRVAEHNIVSDIAAAQRVFSSGLRLTVGGLDLTTRLELDGADVEAIGAAGPLGEALDAEIRQWWRFNGVPWNNPHDPILAAWLLRPRLFEVTRGRIAVDDAGRTVQTDSTDAHRWLSSMDVAGVARLLRERIVRAGTGVASRDSASVDAFS